MSELVAAATVVLVRDSRAGMEVLMLRRDSRLAFAGGAWVFPGGRVDPADYGDEPDDRPAAERAAAVREAAEETGLSVDHAALRRWSHWTPPDHGQTRRFSTAFFVARAPAGDVVVDDGEIREHRWATPAAVLAAQAAGEVELTPPTFITLTQLDPWADVHALLERADEVEPEHFHTRIASLGDDLVALYRGDDGYDDGVTDRPGRRHRLVMAPGAWNYHRDPAD